MNYLTTTDFFDTLFDRTFDGLLKAQADILKTSGFPPYNVAKVEDNKYVIEMAVAGFGTHNLDIELANNILTVKGRFNSEDEQANPWSYVYKGIAERAFTRQFQLTDTVEIKGAELINGMLRIWLENYVPEGKKPKKIDIHSDARPASNLLTKDKEKK